jgi:DNA topoisomerase IA
MRVLCVAEKPSIARSISSILSGGRLETVSWNFLCNAILKSMHFATSVQRLIDLSRTLISITRKPIHNLQ